MARLGDHAETGRFVAAQGAWGARPVLPAKADAATGAVGKEG